MQTLSPSGPFVLALLVLLKDRVGLIPLSDRYDIKAAPLSNERSRDEQVRISIRPSSPTTHSPDRSAVGSFTVLYGENGWGKTHLMLETCVSLAHSRGERKVAVIWEEDDGLWCDPGSFMSRQIVFDTGSHLLVPRFSALERGLPTVFYTTSPFESSKRRRLDTRNVRDVTPSFSPDNPFEGGSLLRAYAKLPEGFDFIDGAEARIRVKIPSLQSVIEQLIKRFSDVQDAQRHGIGQVDPHQRRALMRLHELLDERIEQALVIELLTVQKFSLADAWQLLSMLMDRLGLYNDSNGSALVESELQERFPSAVSDLLELRPFARDGVPNALTLQQFLHVSLPESVRRIGGKTLGRLAAAFEQFSIVEWDMIKQASAHGLIKWSFRGLSSGQVALLLLFSSLSSALEGLESTGALPAFLFVDEGEMFMHPAWQRRYITELLRFLSQYPQIAPRLHVFISTHSMIVAADAPPHRLFDVKAGRMENGFGYGPKDLLDQVYRVDEFQGENAGHLMKQLVDFLTDKDGQALTGTEARAIAEQIADDRLKRYLLDEVRRRVELRNA